MGRLMAGETMTFSSTGKAQISGAPKNVLPDAGRSIPIVKKSPASSSPDILGAIGGALGATGKALSAVIQAPVAAISGLYQASAKATINTIMPPKSTPTKAPNNFMASNISQGINVKPSGGNSTAGINIGQSLTGLLNAVPGGSAVEGLTNALGITNGRKRHRRHGAVYWQNKYYAEMWRRKYYNAKYSGHFRG